MGHGTHTPAVASEVDAWHEHGGEKPQVENAPVINLAVVTGWFVGIIVTLLVVVGLLVMYFNVYHTRLKAERWENDALAAGYYTHRANQDKELSSYSVLDAKAGRVQVPVEDGMRRVLSVYGQAAGVQSAAPAGGSK